MTWKKSGVAAVASTSRFALLVSIVLGTILPTPSAWSEDSRPVKNVIIMIADGCSSEHYTLARWLKGEPLALDGILVGGVRTYISDSVVADSAPAGTAFATGVRTSDKFISVGPKSGTLRPDMEPPDALQYRPLATVLEGARLTGKATGIVATSRVSHATPAAYMAHVHSRSLEEDIMEQAVYQNVNVVLGGGKDYLLPESPSDHVAHVPRGKRSDQENLMAVLQERGYSLVENRAGLRAIQSGKVFGVFAMGPLAAEIDRPGLRPEEPTLAEMTRKAIELLSADPDGFFLMVEGSQVDWANHANDPAHMLSDLLMFDEAVKTALDFAAQDGQTLVLALSDHNTGGMSIGNRATNKSYSQTSIEALVEPLKKMTASAPEMWRRVCEPGDPKKVKPAEVAPEKVQQVVQDGWGMAISTEEAQQILQVVAQDTDNPQNAFGAVLCPTHTCVGYTTHGHTGGDVPLFAFGPSRPTGLHDGPQIGQLTARVLGLDLDKLNGRLFVEVAQAIPAAEVTVETREPGGLVVQVTLNGKKAEMPVNKNVLVLDGQSIELEGLVVYAPKTKKAYIPLQAVQLITGQQFTPPSITH